jgi:hypothetical protein
LIQEHGMVTFFAYPMKRYNLKNSFDHQSSNEI